MDRKTVILMLSGGRDSFLAACNLLESSEKYNIKMVTFDNGCLYGVSNAHTVANRIIEKYGNDRTEYLGVYKTGGIVREFFFPYFNMKPMEQENKFMGMTPSQFHCLICRTSMYICAIYIFINHTPNCLIRDGSLILVNEEDTVGSTLVMESIVVFRQNMKDIIVPYLHPTFLITFSVNQKGPVGQTDITCF